MEDFFLIEQYIDDIQSNITNISRLIYENDAVSQFINTSIIELKNNHNGT